MEKTFLMVKPDGVQRGLIGEVISRFERKGFKLSAAKLMVISDDLAKKHYGEHADKPFFGELVDFITSGPVFAMIWEGEDVVKTARHMMGATKPSEADLGTIRGDYGLTVGKNMIHGSDSLESAEREMNLFFGDNAALEYKKSVDEWVY
ncbi:nucleoside-diphosphate kinase [Jeotgalibacillus salarius]|uniref:Nucleoside diphosphate kinase n=1 Tax=Jeotgalibacillus salarius TaxID=546023 RepID=A0A4Y8LJB3_9BACL|nr:nucleoside-diphosphate kinase [Jeotgalibacillus salarius]TFE03086.1 nucleoside-diphosphate kinase [Jeotgalibacillus salarius]